MRSIRSLFLAIRFLTVIPLPQGREDTPEDMAAAAYWFPLVGFGIGALIVTSWALFPAKVGDVFLAAWTVGFLAIVTGALHLDGLADTCDGLFGGHDRESRLRIMKDKAVGAFGAVAIGLALLMKFAFIISLRGAAVFAVPLTVAAARWAPVIGASLLSYARPEGGTGQSFVDKLSARHAVISALPVVLVCTLAYGSLAHGLDGPQQLKAIGALIGLYLVGTTVLSLAIAAVCRARIGGITGDVLGAMVEVTEVVMLGAAAIIWSAQPWAACT